jgi:hypothetical protein
MGIFNFSKKTKKKTGRDLINSSCLFYAKHLLVNDKGLEKYSTNHCELIIFSMFIASEAYIVAKQKQKIAPDEYGAGLEDFYFDMFLHISKKDLKDKNLKEDFYKFFQLLMQRLDEYKRLFYEDLNDQPDEMPSLEKTINAFIKYVYTEPINMNDKLLIIETNAPKIWAFFVSGVESFSVR